MSNPISQLNTNSFSSARRPRPGAPSEAHPIRTAWALRPPFTPLGSHTTLSPGPRLAGSLPKMNPRTLRDIVKHVAAQPPKKLAPPQVSEIHAKCTFAEGLAELVSGPHFQAAAWRLFHADAPNSHLELLLQMASYEFEALGQATCLASMLAEPLKLHELTLRILKATMALRKQESRLQTCALLFLRVLLAALPAVLVEHPLFPQWKELMFGSYARALRKRPRDHAVPALHWHSFLHFCMACAVLPQEECRDIIRDSWLPFHFMRDGFDYPAQRLASLLWLQLRPKIPGFSVLLNAIERQGLQGKLPLAERASLPLDVSAEELTGNLLTLPADGLVALAREFGCQAEESPDFLASVVTDLALDCNLSFRKLHEHSSFTENDVFDLFDGSALVPFSPDPTFPSFMPMSPSWVSHTRARNAFQYLKQVNARSKNVLERLTITDPSTEKGIKGSSKYFSEIQSMKIAGSKAQLALKNKRLISTLKAGDSVLLLEIHKPNRHGGVGRIVRYGIYSCILTKVHDCHDDVLVDWNSNGVADTYNALILLPSPDEQPLLLDDDDALSKSLIGVWNKENQIVAPQFSVDCISGEALESFGAVSVEKRKKLDNNYSAQKNSSYKLANCEITLSNATTTTTPEDVSEALIQMLLRKSVMIENPRGNVTSTLIGAFLRNVSVNWPEETCLVVMPTKAAVELLHIESALSSSCYKAGSSNEYVAQRIEMALKNLEKVAKLGEVLGLEEYDFLSSIRNALMLYHSHVEPKWRQFLSLLSKENFTGYPFALIQEETFESAVDKIVDDYSSIRSIFAEIEECLPLDNFDLRNLKAGDYDQIRRFFAARAKFLVLTDADLASVDRTFDNIIVHNVSSIPLVKGGFKRLSLLGDSTIDWATRVLIKSSESRNEIARLTGWTGVKIQASFNPGFRYCAQHIRLPSTKSSANVDEAKFCVYLYQYMRILGYPWSKVLIVVKLEQMRCLIEEILLERQIRKTDLSCDTPGMFSFGWPILQSLHNCSAGDYLIVSCSGEPSLREIQGLTALSKMGLYLVGSKVDYLSKIHSGELDLVFKETYLTGKRTSKDFQSMASADKMGEYVDRLLKQK
ncbi:hypothetical protein METBIDRAFT_30683 [Metschnikowia bicuspidata var. bicuspidata NRRL YB-4993]|uniref:Uncharacterized protein n=1 Tax=Metschnikowia bicuspidata var. bicuspidata NRRL YB-4993 TaxID=869754 RepID=A0A1A0HK72_9ASCO|nr:hypothetical protein METBIDRAFT_30683 [Metschnikowia bicuspidata var. bicuspidata NRRL YB-4993]OBA24401.1 hypothetical protein METBIDRAFT_30683 [Metschnikowia bicuspidata var. bicuspidata NRRL YB-4993]